MRRHGFNLVETLVATLILSGTVVTVGALSTRVLYDTQQNLDLERAASLADRQMALIEAQGVSTFLEQGPFEGDFGTLAPGVTWSVAYEALDVDQLYRLELTVTWLERKHPRQYTVTTMFNGNGIELMSGDETSEQE